MKAEIISIGSELTSGQNLDTNSRWLSLRLAELGIAVGWHTTIADDLDANVDAFRIATQRARLVLTTGGLGPTQDDLTREALARLGEVNLVLHQPSLEQIEQMFQQRGRDMPERNKVQAMFPEGAEVLTNIRGTAPGIWMRHGDSFLAAMPGVPAEMHVMFEGQVKPRLRELGLAGAVLIQRKINAFGAGESTFEEKLFDLTRRGQVPEVGITASDAIISLRILARAATTEEANTLIEPIERTIRERLGDFIFGVEGEDLADAVTALLASRRKTVSVAEGVTGGHLSEALTRVPGISAWYRGGMVAYDNRLKVELLGVPQTLLEEKGAVSAEVAEAMAVGCRTRLQTDLALSTVGWAGPHSPTGSVGQVYAALAWEGGVHSIPYQWVGNRLEIQRRTAKIGLNILRLHLLKGDARE